MSDAEFKKLAKELEDKFKDSDIMVKGFKSDASSYAESVNLIEKILEELIFKKCPRLAYTPKFRNILEIC